MTSMHDDCLAAHRKACTKLYVKKLIKPLHLLLGGSWVVLSGVISPLIGVIIMVILLITVLIATHEPPSTKREASEHQK